MDPYVDICGHGWGYDYKCGGNDVGDGGGALS